MTTEEQQSSAHVQSGPAGDAPRLYRDLSSWWPLLSKPQDYAEEAEFYRRILVSACARAPKTVLELGCGGGSNASHLKAHFRLTLTDLSPGMLAVSRSLNPECEHILGDMRSLRLGRLFDAVFVHDAIMYMTTEADLRSAMETAFVHCAAGGVALFCPDHVRETFRPSTKHGGHDAEGRGMRYLEWTWDPDPKDTSYVTDFAYLLRDERGVRCEYDHHILGLFPRRDWLRLLAAVGFQPKGVPSEHSEIEPGTCEVFVGLKPSDKRATCGKSATSKSSCERATAHNSSPAFSPPISASTCFPSRTRHGTCIRWPRKFLDGKLLGKPVLIELKGCEGLYPDDVYKVVME